MSNPTCSVSDKPEAARATILIVDDQPENLEILSKVLQPYYSVRATRSGQQALAAAMAEPKPELVLLDIMMPVMDGYAVLERLHGNPATCDIPVIFVTALGSDKDEQRGFDMGAVDYITKPIRPAVVLARVRAHLELKRSRHYLTRMNVQLEDRITERTQELQQSQSQVLQAEKMAAIGSLAVGVAHDFNNLLTPILGYGELLLREVDASHPWRSSVEQIHKAGQRARDLLRQLLAFGSKYSPGPSIVDLNQVVSGFQKLLRRTIRDDIQLEIKLAPSPLSLLADVGQLEQVIMNLVVNAQDAMRYAGKITIETSEAHLDSVSGPMPENLESGRFTMLSVTDNGIGMDKATLERIFDPFFTTKPVGKGTGLGLSTVLGIVKQHGGGVSVHSKPGAGTIFRLYFPQVEELKASQSDTSPQRDDQHGSETIMVVEDNDMLRDITVRVLNVLGYKVLSATCGKECLEALEAHGGPLDLLLTDVVMPGMNGKEVFKQVQQRFPSIKVLFMSGYTDEVISHHGILDEKIAFIPKPFSIQALSAKVRSVLDER